MDFFVKEDSIVRKIWGQSDVIMFIFAGAAAEFALHKDVDWLYFTGKLPADPIGRMFTTVSFSRRIVFSNKETAFKTIDSIVKIHDKVESDRKAKIPDASHLDVLSMLIDYSIRAFELLRHKLSDDEKDEVFDVFYRVGKRMKIVSLPDNYKDWEKVRLRQLNLDYEYSSFSADLFAQYKRQLGPIRYKILVKAQKLMVPDSIRNLLGWRRKSAMNWLVPLYKFSRSIHADNLVRGVLLPSEYKKQINAMDVYH